jgi:adenylosuccinate lyase
MELNSLSAISPVDGRYRKKLEHLSVYFSEYALIKYRVRVEIEYFLALSKLDAVEMIVESSCKEKIENLLKDFSVADAERIKEIEKTTNHDVKAVEYFLKEKFEAIGLRSQLEFIHFGLTSQDINNTAVPLILKDFISREYIPQVSEVIEKLRDLANEWKDVPMLARTHGQPASPTLLGKEFSVFVERLENQISLLKHIPFSAKFGGATGNFNANYAAYPETDWVTFADDFVNHRLGLRRSQFTTQIEHYDNMAALFDNLKRINTIFTDLAQDMWLYISMDYFKQKIKKDEVGSSAMPHKVNPIDFENGEGNLGIANSGWEFLSRKLPVSRLQRDLTDSTVTRFIGVPAAHSVLAMKSILTGLNKLLLNEDKIREDLENNWAVVSEAIQTILRREGYPKPYEALKELTRTGEKITEEKISKFIDGLNVSEKIKEELKQFSPFNYTGRIM